MREHQIAISLKPQQFELLQRLARERGFKSVTAYVKQKIVELALGVESGLPAVGSEPMQGTGAGPGLTVENELLFNELTRIHNELRTFVSRSMPDQLAGGTSERASSSATTFALPPPGQVGHGQDSNVAGTGLTPVSTASSQSADATAGTTAGGEVSSQVLPSNNLSGMGFNLGKFAGSSAVSRFQAPLDNADRLSGYREIMDDLEELADRAFAISPRLGALDEEAPAEAATGRGGRSGSNSIVVDPILPDGTNTPEKGRKVPVVDPKATPPQPKPISMVPPLSPSDLPGPDEVTTAAPLGSVSQRAGPAPVADPVPKGAGQAGVTGAVPLGSNQAAVTGASPLGANQAAVTAAVSEGADQAALTTAVPPGADQGAVTEAVGEGANQGAVAGAVSEGADRAATADLVSRRDDQAVVEEKKPLPGDDLLSELLDESLVAHAETPRPADNPFAAVPLLAARAGTEGSAATFDATAGTPPFVDPEADDDQRQDARMDELSVPAQVPNQVNDPEQDLRSGPAQENEGVSEVAASYNDVEDQAQGRTQSVSQNKGKGRANLPASAPSTDAGQDPDTHGHSNLSGGPPPKRRRT